MLFLLMILVVILLVVQWLACSPLKWRGSGVKWLMPWPVFGNTLGALSSTYYEFWLRFYQKFEGHRAVGFHLFSRPTLLARDPAIIKQIAVTEGNQFLCRGLVGNDNDPFNRNLLYVQGEEWRTMRAKITPYLAPSRVKAMLPIIQDCVATLCEQLRLSSDHGPVDIDELTIKMSTDVIVSSVFGLQGDALRHPDSLIFKLQKELLGFFFGLRILVGFISPTLYRVLDLMILSRSSTEKVVAFVHKILNMRMKGVGVRPDFMQGMVDLYEKEHEKEHGRDYYNDGTKVVRFNKRGVASQCMIMFAASTENIGRNLGFLFYELALNRQIQDRLRQEVLDVKARNGGSLGYDQLAELKYMDMVISESLRKYPPVIAISRQSTTQTRIGDVIIDKGTIIAIPIIGIHRDPNYYPNPEKFEPERFAPGTEKETGTYLPFGLGPKGCVGIRLTQVEMKLAISEVITKFELSCCSATAKQIKFHFGPTLRSAQGIKIITRPLSK